MDEVKDAELVEEEEDGEELDEDVTELDAMDTNDRSVKQCAHRLPNRIG